MQFVASVTKTLRGARLSVLQTVEVLFTNKIGETQALFSYPHTAHLAFFACTNQIIRLWVAA